MIIIGSGSRDWIDIKPIRKVMTAIKAEFPNFIYYHGNQRGFDTLSYMALERMKHKEIEPFDANWDEYGKKAGMMRNQAMLNAALLNRAWDQILLVAMPLPQSKGTFGMIGICRRAEIQVRVYDIEGNLIER